MTLLLGRNFPALSDFWSFFVFFSFEFFLVCFFASVFFSFANGSLDDNCLSESVIAYFYSGVCTCIEVLWRFMNIKTMID